MRSKDPKLMQEIIDFVDRYYDAYHCTPTTREIAENTSLGKSAVYNYLAEMRDNGMIDYDGKMIVTEAIQKRITEYNRAGVLGSIPCGALTLEEEAIEDFVDLPINIFGGGDLFILHAYGDSMIGAGIDSGDLVVVQKRSYALDGDIVVAYVEGEGNTLKRFYNDEKKKMVILHPENEKYQDIIVKDCKIQGIVTTIIKKAR